LKRLHVQSEIRRRRANSAQYKTGKRDIAALAADARTREPRELDDGKRPRKEKREEKKDRPALP